MDNLFRQTPTDALRSDGAQTREAILQATFRRLGVDGYAGLNLRAIAAEAGVNHGLIRYHFGTKEQLVLTMLDTVNRRLLERQQAMYAQDDSLADQWEQACDFYESDLRSGFVRMLMELMAASFSDATLRAEFLPRLLAWHRVVEGAVVAAIERHDLNLPVSARAIASWISCFWVGMEAEMTLGVPERDGHHREALRAMHALLKSLERPAATPAPGLASELPCASRRRRR